MKWTESTKKAFESKEVQAAYEWAKTSKLDSAKLYLGKIINEKRAEYLRDKGRSIQAIADELNVSENFCEKHILSAI